MSRLPILAALAALAVPLFTACSSFPNEEAMYGNWANLEMGTVRGFLFEESSTDPELAGETDVFTFYLYQGGGAPVPQQKGTFTTERFNDGADTYPALVLDIVWSSDTNLVGQLVPREFIDHESNRFTVQSDTSSTGRRTYNWVEVLP